MHRVVSWLFLEIPLVLLTAAATHLVMSFCQTMLHRKLGHQRMGGVFYRNHVNFHHTYYSRDHLVSTQYQGDEGNNTPYFIVPVLMAIGCAYLLLPLDLFGVVVAAAAASYVAHVFFDREYHVEGSRFLRFAWFRRKQQLHFVHHRHANTNYAVIDFFWDRLLGTYRAPEADSARQAAPTKSRTPAAEPRVIMARSLPKVQVADGVGFEPTRGCPLAVFKTAALNRSATHPAAGN